MAEFRKEKSRNTRGTNFRDLSKRKSPPREKCVQGHHSSGSRVRGHWARIPKSKYFSVQERRTTRTYSIKTPLGGYEKKTEEMNGSNLNSLSQRSDEGYGAVKGPGTWANCRGSVDSL